MNTPAAESTDSLPRQIAPARRTYLPLFLRRRVRRIGYRLTLIRYCIHCDGSINEAEDRGRGFSPDRWVGHYPHERWEPQGPLRREGDPRA